MEPEGEGEGLELGMEPEGEPHSLRPSRSVPFLPVGCPQSSGRRGACSRPGRSGRCTAASERWPSAPESPSFEDPGVVPRKMLMKIIKYYIFFFTHQVVPESLHHLPNIPFLQSLPDLRIIVVDSAPNLLRGQGVGGRHGGGMVVVRV